jgi:hypothetical protein
MLHKLSIAALAGALGFASFSALALDLPDSGSKNFSPAGDTPTYFANERLPIAARTADTNANDWSAEEAAAPIMSTARPATSAHSSSRRHSKYVSAQRSGTHVSGKSRGNSHSPNAAKMYSGKAIRTASAHHGLASARSAGKTATSFEKTTRVASSRGAKSTTAKHSKAGARHAETTTPPPKKA